VAIMAREMVLLTAVVILHPLGTMASTVAYPSAALLAYAIIIEAPGIHLRFQDALRDVMQRRPSCWKQ